MTRRSLLQTETALWLATLAVVLAARRLFDSWDYAPMWLMAAAGGHVTAAVTRRQRWPLGAAAAASVALLVIVEGLALYSGTLWLRLVPTAQTLRQAAADVVAAWEAFSIVEAPTPADPGFLLVGSAVVWLAAFVADTMALRARAVGEALLPAFVMFAFIAVLGTDDWRYRSAAAMVLIAVAFVAAHGIHITADRVPLGAAERRRASVPMRTALRMGTLAAVGAAALVPLLPGSDAPAVVSWKDLDGTSPGARVTISPLVNAQGRLVGVSGAEMFRVQADAPAYWRVSGLSRFDGTYWGSQQLYGRTSKQFSGSRDGASLLTQEITIAALDSIWLPAAYEPVAYEGPGALYDAETATLVTQHSSELAPEFSYTVVSAVPTPSAAELEAAVGEVPPEIAETYLALPESFSSQVIDLADEVTAAAVGPYAKALALQNFFLDSFVYSLRVSGGHDTDRMEQFLFTERRGYCEQFAGTYAAMARAVGLPARVAVGFTPGEFIDGSYVVRGEHYHAWPEVWIGGRWVYFEPTPGRGAPGATGYTGVAPQQAAPGDPEAAGEAGSGFIGPLGLRDFDQSAGTLDAFSDAPGALDATAPARSWTQHTLVGLLAVLGLGLAWLICVPSAVRLRRALAHRRARSDPKAQVEAAWDDVAETLFCLGLDQRAAETHAEFADRVDRRLRIDAREMHVLAAAAQHAAYAADPPSTSAAAGAQTSAAKLEARVRNARSRWDRVGAACRLATATAGPRSRKRRDTADG